MSACGAGITHNPAGATDRLGARKGLRRTGRQMEINEALRIVLRAAEEGVGSNPTAQEVIAIVAVEQLIADTSE